MRDVKHLSRGAFQKQRRKFVSLMSDCRSTIELGYEVPLDWPTDIIDGWCSDQNLAASDIVPNVGQRSNVRGELLIIAEFNACMSLEMLK